MRQKKDILKKSRDNPEEILNANELLQESLDDVIASLIDLNVDLRERAKGIPNDVKREALACPL